MAGEGIDLGLVLLVVCAVVLAFFLLLRLMGRSKFILSTSVQIREATVSRQLVPRFDSIVSEGDTITFVGGDGYYHSSRRGLQLHDAIRRWSDRGCNIKYILVSGSIQSNRPLISLLERVKNFRVYFVAPNNDNRQILASWDIIERFRTFHPTLVSDKSGKLKAAWIEGYHPDGSHIAYDIEFYCDHIPQRVVEDSKIYQKDFENLIQKSTCVEAGNYAAFLENEAQTGEMA